MDTSNGRGIDGEYVMGIAYNTSIVRDGLVLHLDAANVKSYPGTGTVWKDLSGNGNDGTLVNGVGYSSDNNGVMTFDGVNDYGDIADTPILNMQQGLTISAFIRLETLENSVYPMIVRKGNGPFSSGAGSDQYGLWLWRGGLSQYGAGFRIVDETDTLRTVNSNIDNNTILNQWILLTGTFQTGDSTVVKIFYDGSLINQNTYSGSHQIKQTNGSLRIGFMNGFSTGHFGGKIPSVSVYNRALTPEEIQQNFNALRGRYGI